MDRHEHILSCRKLTIGYPNQDPLVEGLNWDIAAGQTWALLGRNGTGKSSLFRSIIGLLPLSAGEISIGTSFEDQQLIDLVRYTPTQRSANQNMTVDQFLALGAYRRSDWLGRLDEKEKSRVYHWCKRMEVDSWLSRKLGTLSDGQFQRVRICQALISEAPMLLLDEPTAFLDFQGREEVLELLKAVQADTNLAIVFSSHELDLAAKYADNFLLLKGEGANVQLQAPQSSLELKKELLITAKPA